MSSTEKNRHWRFLTNHAQVLLCIARDENVRVRDIAALTGLTERATQRIVGDLVEGGFLRREKIGRRTRYHVERGVTMRHPFQFDHSIGELLDLLQLDESPDGAATSTDGA